MQVILIYLQSINLSNMDSEHKKWYVLTTKPNQEILVDKSLNDLKLDVESFLPLREEVRKCFNKMALVQVPLVPRLVFIKVSKEERFEILNSIGYDVNYMIDKASNSSLIIPDYQMTPFIKFTKIVSSKYKIYDDKVKPGDKVKVIKGEFAGLEGELVRLKSHKRVVVKLDGLFSIAVDAYIPKNHIKILT